MRFSIATLLTLALSVYAAGNSCNGDETPAPAPPPAANNGETGSVAVPAGFDASIGDPAGAKNLGNGQGKQFITGACLSNADCASGCCAAVRGGALCSGVGAQFQNGKQGCGSFNAGKRSVDITKRSAKFRAH
ncbi:Biotrophy-associated secreted protein 2 [Cladobotryum mycophilum]|uniref:Biotrophy-associated secreted protein 2 n=1 Tax=Cladobotryum mycophilum TaxID=491253 RepID=A0ABR0S6T5_9HYPO